MASVTGSQCCWPNVKLFLELFPVPWRVWWHFFFSRISFCHFFIVVAIMLQVCLLLLACNLCFTLCMFGCVVRFLCCCSLLGAPGITMLLTLYVHCGYESVYVWVCVQPQCVQSNQEATGNVLISIVQLPPLRHLPQLAANSIKGLWSLCNHLKLFACEHSHS